MIGYTACISSYFMGSSLPGYVNASIFSVGVGGLLPVTIVRHRHFRIR